MVEEALNGLKMIGQQSHSEAFETQIALPGDHSPCASSAMDLPKAGSHNQVLRTDAISLVTLDVSG